MADKLFKGKRVALIGPAPHILERVQDFYEYDLVCRVNRMAITTGKISTATGYRCDVWYPANKLLMEHPFICSLHTVTFIRTTKKASVLIPEPRRYKFSQAKWDLEGLKAELGCTPNRGLRAMIDILQNDPKELYITGFTFYQGDGAYYEGYSTPEHTKLTAEVAGNLGGHKQEPQIKYFKEKILTHPAVKIDWKMQELFK